MCGLLFAEDTDGSVRISLRETNTFRLHSLITDCFLPATLLGGHLGLCFGLFLFFKQLLVYSFSLSLLLIEHGRIPRKL